MPIMADNGLILDHNCYRFLCLGPGGQTHSSPTGRGFKPYQDVQSWYRGKEGKVTCSHKSH